MVRRRPPAPRALGRVRATGSIVVCGVLAVAALGCGGDKKPGGGPGGGRPKGPVVVRTIEAKEEVVERVVEMTGTLGGAEEVVVSAEVDGRVERVAADLGDAVRAGGVLVQLQSTTPRLLAEQAEADYLQSLAKLGVDDGGLGSVDPNRLASVKRAEADLEEARRNAARISELQAKGVVTQNDLDTIRTRERVAEAAAQSAHEDAAAAVATARAKRAALGLARKRLNDTTVASPIAGVVGERLVSLGELVKAGQPIARVVVSDPLKLRGDVPERYMGEVAVDMPVTVTLDAVGLEASGKISRVGPAVTSTTRTFKVEALIPNAEQRLKPGLFARARVVVGADETVIAVPETAVSALAGVTKLFVLEEGHAKERKVDILRKRGSDALVVGEVKPGDTVITTAIARLFDGAPVSVDGSPAPPPTDGTTKATAKATKEGAPPEPKGKGG